MTRPRLLLLLGLVLALLNLNAVAAGYPLIVQISPTTSITAVASYLGGTVVDSIPEFNEYLLQVPVVPIVQTLPLLGIDWMELNSGVTLPPLPHLMYLQVAPNAAADWYKAQPALVLINAGKALAYSTGRGVVVADINSQVDYSHPALRGHLTSGYDFVTSKPSGATALNQSSASYLDQSSASYLDQSSASYLDQSSASYLDQSSASYLDGLNPAYSHGTLCAGIIAVVAPDAMIMPLRTFDDNGSSDLFMIGKAIRYAVKLGAQVINMSFGTITDSKAISSAVRYAQRENVALAASAGNNLQSPIPGGLLWGRDNGGDGYPGREGVLLELRQARVCRCARGEHHLGFSWKPVRCGQWYVIQRSDHSGNSCTPALAGVDGSCIESSRWCNQH